MNWSQVKLVEAAEINPGIPRDVTPEPSELVTFLPMAAIGEDGSLETSETRPYKTVSKGYTVFCRGDVLLAKITPCMENGKAALVNGICTKVVCGSTEFHVLRARNGIDPRYLFHLIWNKPFRRLAARNMTGSAGQKRVPKSFLETHSIPLPHKNGKPDLEEQKRIAAILDKADAIRRKRQQALRLTDDFLRSVFLDMFGDPEARGWEMTTAEGVAADDRGSIRTGPFGSQLLHSEFVDDGIAVLGIDNAVTNQFAWGKPRFVTEEKYEELKRYTVHPGDVLITIMGTCGRCAVVPDDIPRAINTKHLCCITLDQNQCLPEFLHSYFLIHPIARRYLTLHSKGAIMDGLNMGIIKNLPVPEAPLSLQRDFARIIKQRCGLAARLTSQQDEAEDLFSSLQQRAFRGEL